MNAQTARDPESDSIGRRLRRGRMARGLSQAALAAKAGREQTTVSKIETGAQPRPDLETQVSLAKALGVPLEWLQHGTGVLPDELRAALEVEVIGEQFHELDDMLNRAFVAGRHTPTAVAFLRPVLIEHIGALRADGPAEEHIETARFWLDAVDRLRAEGRHVSFVPIVMLGSRLQADALRGGPPRLKKPRQTGLNKKRRR